MPRVALANLTFGVAVGVRAVRRAAVDRALISGADSPVRTRLLGMVTLPNGCRLAVEAVAPCLWILPAVPRS